MKSILELKSKKVMDSCIIPALNSTEAYKESRCDRRSTNRRLFGFVLNSALIILDSHLLCVLWIRSCPAQSSWLFTDYLPVNLFFFLNFPAHCLPSAVHIQTKPSSSGSDKHFMNCFLKLFKFVLGHAWITYGQCLAQNSMSVSPKKTTITKIFEYKI